MRKIKLSCYKQTKLMELFIVSYIAIITASLMHVNRTTTIYYFRWLRL